MVGYGDPVPYDGMSNELDRFATAYVGTSLRIRSSGTVVPALAERPGDELRLISEVFERAEEDGWRELVIATHSLLSKTRERADRSYRWLANAKKGCGLSGPVGTPSVDCRPASSS
jgi:hypothetical protein